MLFFLLPLMFSNLLQSVSGTVSSILLGRIIGVNALAAVSAVFPLLFFLISFVIGIGSGSSVLIGQAFGAGNHERLKSIAGTTLSFTFLLGTLLAVIGGVFTREVLQLIGTPANIIADTASYANILFWAMPVLFLYVVYTTFLRGTGDSKTPFYFLLISTSLSLLLTPALILGWVGLPPLGVNGVAFANVTSNLITFMLFLAYLHKVQHPLRFDRGTLHHLNIDWQILKLVIKIGVPTSVQMIMVSLSEVAVISFVNKYGSGATAAYGAVNQVASYVQLPAASLGIAVSVFGAQSIGAGRFDNLRKVLRAGVALNYTVGGFLVLLVYLFARDILSWFLTDVNTLDIANTLLMITLWSYLIFGNSSVFVGLMRSSGTVLWPTIISILSIWVVEVPTAYILSSHIGIEGIWIGYLAAFIVGLLFQYFYYLFFWKKKQHSKLVY